MSLKKCNLKFCAALRDLTKTCPHQTSTNCTDSKASYLHNEATRYIENEIIWWYGSGCDSNAAHTYLLSQIEEAILTYGRIHLYVWLGTCNLTVKNGKYVYLNPEHGVAQFIVDCESIASLARRRKFQRWGINQTIKSQDNPLQTQKPLVSCAINVNSCMKNQYLCSGCKLSFCLKCTKVTEALYNCIVAGEMDDFYWTFRSCKSTSTSLRNISDSLEDFKGKYDYRMTYLEEKVNHIELTTKQGVTSQVSSMKEESINSLKVDINSVVDKRNLELEDRKRRELNITIFNLMEHSSDNTAENKKADELDIRAITASLGIENLNITTFYRLGKKKPAKTCPLRVVLDSKSQRKFLLENAK